VQGYGEGGVCLYDVGRWDEVKYGIVFDTNPFLCQCDGPSTLSLSPAQ
jgi:hypothetical protein